ncbi:hypothetical conserved protein [Oceanobacillus iheyensis HTE831]|uniref:Hypothetical conserved protein n=1 Tax=Oceanobacillus iheyensis (strain DSM 14371 / CIP 107618 / JCM 11309 / KCTC 3954 / HTE831) TaxID=221109 RepID=Q8ETU8_OCEIH|nr:stage II sporulation protein M [Oceanobacillus iheyensis]BAC12113.1 hypothetical conserved protein [Oceanobacillus iheyensis HTE831]
MKRLKLKFVWIVCGVYFSSFIVGIFVSNLHDNNFEYTPNPLKDTFVSIDTLKYIFTNNIKVFLILLTGFFLLKIPTIISLTSNGLMLGYFLGGLSLNNIQHVLLSLSIHGVPEILSFFIAAYIAFLGRDEFLEYKKFNIKLLVIGVLMVGVAAILETYVSPYFI